MESTVDVWARGLEAGMVLPLVRLTHSIFENFLPSFLIDLATCR